MTWEISEPPWQSLPDDYSGEYSLAPGDTAYIPLALKVKGKEELELYDEKMGFSSWMTYLRQGTSS